MTHHRQKAPSLFHAVGLTLLTFALIFGPRLYGQNELDLITGASVIALVWAALSTSASSVARNLPYDLMILLAILFTYGLFVSIGNGAADFFYPLKYARCGLNALGVVAMATLVQKYYPDDWKDRILCFCFLAIALHSWLMVWQYLDSDAREFIYSISGYDRPKEGRVSGLTISYNTLTLLTGAGLMLGVLIQRQLVSMLTTPLYVLCLPGLAAALSLAGRFAALVSLVGLLCALVYRFKLWTIIKASSVIIVGATITVLAFRFLAPDEVQARFQESTAYAMIEAFQEFSYSGSLSDTYFGRTIETVVEDMWFLPHDTVTIIFGNSHSGRGDQHYIPSDVGYVLLMFGNGLVGTVLTVWIYLKAILHACMRKDALLSARFMLIYFSAACLLVSVKEQVLLTRHAFTFFVALYLIILSQKVTRRVGRR